MERPVLQEADYSQCDALEADAKLKMKMPRLCVGQWNGGVIAG